MSAPAGVLVMVFCPRCGFYQPRRAAELLAMNGTTSNNTTTETIESAIAKFTPKRCPKCYKPTDSYLTERRVSPWGERFATTA